jgi:hypothetical protein
MAEVTDPDGVEWSVRRSRWYGMFPLVDTGGDDGFGIVVILILFVGVWWPFWFLAHWLGMRWRIVITRDGEQMDDEWVRGWRRSRRRIQEIIDAATAGAVQSNGRGTGDLTAR